MRRGAIGLGAALAVAIGSHAGMAGERATAGVSLKASDHNVRLGARVAFRGRLSARPAGSSRAGRPVVLQADRWPFDDRYATVARTRTGPGGRFRFTHRPRRNTRYRVAAKDGQAVSRARTVYADLRGGIESFVSSGDRAVIRIYAIVPRYARLPGRRVHAYVFHTRRPRGRHAGSALLRRAGGRRWTAVVRFKRSGLTRRHYAGFCVRERKPDAWGEPHPIDRACGRRTLRKPSG